jgi:hypothetical protein
MKANPAYQLATLTELNDIRGRHTFDVFPDNPADETASGARNPTNYLQLRFEKYVRCTFSGTIFAVTLVHGNSVTGIT